MCCGDKANWKREVVPDHKFDFIDVHEFHSKGCFTRFKYVWLYILLLKSFLVYVFDIYTAVALLASNKWAGDILDSNDKDALKVPFTVGKWIFCGCIIFSFLLLAYEARKARRIIKSRDISFAYTNVMANNYYSFKSYNHFCFFSNINDSKKKKDEFAFFVFFTFKGWKRLVVADGPRQVINGLTLYSFAKSLNFTGDLGRYFEGNIVKKAVVVSMSFTVVVFAGSAILLIIAAFMYVPLLCYIQGNLKEYCCHKIDKRISELMKRKTRKRLAKEAAIAKAEARGDFSHLKDKKGNIKAQPLDQPTLPNVDFDDFDDGKSSTFHAYPPSSVGRGPGGPPIGVPVYPPPPMSDFGGGTSDFYRPRPEHLYGESISSDDQFGPPPFPPGQSTTNLVPQHSVRSNGSMNKSQRGIDDDETGSAFYSAHHPPPPMYPTMAPTPPPNSHNNNMNSNNGYQMHAPPPPPQSPFNPDQARQAELFAATQLPTYQNHAAPPPPPAFPNGLPMRQGTPTLVPPTNAMVGRSTSPGPLQYNPTAQTSAGPVHSPSQDAFNLAPPINQTRGSPVAERGTSFYDDVYGGQASPEQSKSPSPAPHHHQNQNPATTTVNGTTYETQARARLLERTQQRQTTMSAYTDNLSIGAESDFGDYYASAEPDHHTQYHNSNNNNNNNNTNNLYHQGTNHQTNYDPRYHHQ